MEFVSGNEWKHIPNTSNLKGIIKITPWPVNDHFRAEIPIDQADDFLRQLGTIAQGIRASKLVLRPPKGIMALVVQTVDKFSL